MRLRGGKTMKYEQSNGENSFNQQAKEINNYGISYQDAKNIAMDVFKDNFLKLTKESNQLVMARVNKLIDDFLMQLKKDNEEGILECKNPDFQYVFYEASKNYARSGEDSQEELLVNLLVERTKYNSRNLLQIVLDESVSVVQKLTQEQINILSVLFILKYTQIDQVSDISEIFDNYRRLIIPLTKIITDNYTNVQHLIYTSCGTESISSRTIIQGLRQDYPGLLSKGFSKEILEQQALPTEICTQVIKKEGEMFYVKFSSEEELEEYCKKESVNKDIKNKLNRLLNNYTLSEQEINDKLKREFPELLDFSSVYEKARLGHFNLSSVGISIGYANIKKNYPTFTDLSIWIK